MLQNYISYVPTATGKLSDDHLQLLPRLLLASVQMPSLLQLIRVAVCEQIKAHPLDDLHHPSNQSPYSMHAGMYVIEDKSNRVQQGASKTSPPACIIHANILVASIIVKMC